jgi:hypothetical protein
LTAANVLYGCEWFGGHVMSVFMMSGPTTAGVALAHGGFLPRPLGGEGWGEGVESTPGASLNRQEIAMSITTNKTTDFLCILRRRVVYFTTVATSR